MSEPLLEAKDVVKHYPVGGSMFGGGAVVHALDGVSISLGDRETLAVVGESGCGKTTLARCLLRLTSVTSGSIRIAGRNLTRPSAAEIAEIPRLIQIVFQDPYASLNPRRTIYRTVADPLRLHAKGRRADRRRKVEDLLQLVGLGPQFMDRYPHELSGGQRQRVAIARALAVQPKVVICDEPVSALDVSVQSQVINLLKRLQSELGMSYIFITHDLRLVQHMADRIAVMYLGEIVEVADAREFKSRIRHPYSQALFSAIPVSDPEAADRKATIVLSGDVPSPVDPPSGCRFHTRCPYSREICATTHPELRQIGERQARCHFADEPGFPPEPGQAVRELAKT